MYSIRTPRIYRYLEKQFVDDFFEHGRLRLSSFSQFAQHEDEQRFDDKEGTAWLFHRTSENGGQTLAVNFEFDRRAYVLCGSAAPSKPLMKQFGADSAIIIRDTRGFVEAIGEVVPGLIRAVHGQCSYQKSRAIERDLGWLDIAESSTSDPNNMNSDVVDEALNQLITDDVLFLKHAGFFGQTEYRFLWFANETEGFIDVEVPDARQFCERWEDQGEWIALN